MFASRELILCNKIYLYTNIFITKYTQRIARMVS
jgi:hypothetical protein